VFVYVLMPWLSKYRALRRPQPEWKGDIEDGSGAAPAPPLRAVTLVDPQAYALRAVSLVPVASGWGGGSSSTLGGGRRLSVMSGGGLSLIQENIDDEVLELREENRKLRMQLRLAELSPAATTLNRDARQAHSPPASPRTNRNAQPANNAGIEIDSRGRLLPRVRDTPPPGLRKSGGRGVDESESPRPTALKREVSKGLSMLRPPKAKPARDDGHQVSFADF